MSLAGSAPLASGGSGRNSSLAPPFEPTPVSSSSSTARDEQTSDNADDKKKQKRRSLFSFGKKKSDEATTTAASVSSSASTAAPPASSTAASKATLSKLPPPPPPKAKTTSGSAGPKPPAKDGPVRKPTSPIQTDNISVTSSGVGGSNTAGGSNYGGYHVLPPSSPGRSIAALSSSPRMSSPAGSQIFERDVQESGSVLMPNSPAIPSHINTENYIPPVLDASSEAITDDHLDPDTVEIITHAHHQPVVLSVAGVSNNVGGASSSGASGMGAWVDDVASSFVGDKDDNASNYGSFDTTDVRRLSFISFADVVQAEQQQQQHQQAAAGSGSLAGLTSLAAMGVRSPSPMRSPTTTTATTDRFGTSPPTSKSGSIKGLDLSPARKPVASPARSPTISAVGTGGPVSSSGSTLLVGGGEIAVETMSQALRRTGSGDFSGLRSTPQSPI